MSASHTYRLATFLLLGIACPGVSAGESTVWQAGHVPEPIVDQATGTAVRKPDVVYIPTAPATVDAMLRLAAVTHNDVVYDLGCGDGRLVVAAASRYGARGMGIDIDPQRVAEATAHVRASNLEGRVRIVQGDLLEVGLKGATVVILYLSAELNAKLRPKLLADLRPGARIVSHHFGMGDWKPDESVRVGDDMLYLWRIPQLPRSHTPPG